MKIIATIDKEVSLEKSVKDRDKIVFFLPEDELHELSLLFYSYIARKEGFEVVYLGASVPVKDLKEVQRVTGAKAFFSAYVSARDKQELENMFSSFKEMFPSLPFYVTGFQIREHNPILPDNFHVITSSNDFKKCLKQLNMSN